MTKRIISFFDRAEDKIRGKLSERPILYAIMASVGTVLLWRGIWHTADVTPIIQNGLVSIVVGILILLLTGVFVSSFIGNSVILTGLRKEKKLTEKTRAEVERDIEIEKAAFGDIRKTLAHIEKEIEHLEGRIDE